MSRRVLSFAAGLAVVGCWSSVASAVQPQAIAAVSTRSSLVGVMTFGPSQGIAVIKDSNTGRTSALGVGNRVPFAPNFVVKSIARGRVVVSDGEDTQVILAPEDDVNGGNAVSDEDDSRSYERPVTSMGERDRPVLVADDDEDEEDDVPAIVQKENPLRDASAIIEHVVIDPSSRGSNDGRWARMMETRPSIAPPTEAGPEGIPLAPALLDKVAVQEDVLDGDDEE